MDLKNYSSLGAIIAIICLVLVIVFISLGQIPLMVGLFLAALAVARLT